MDTYKPSYVESTPLHFSESPEKLLAQGASTEAMSDDSLTPLHHAALNGDTKQAHQLLNSDSVSLQTLFDETGGDSSIDIDAKDSNNNTPLHLAAQNGHTKMVQLLRRHCASTAAINNDHYIPLHHAAKNDHFSIVELLVDHASIESRDKYNNTPLHLAAQSGQTGMVELLLVSGVEFNNV